jgi:hypothetical protein
MKKTHTVTTLLRPALLLAVTFAGGNLAQAQTCSATWTGNAGDGAWTTAGNWSPRRVPGPTSDVCIPLLTTANATPPISIQSLQISQGGLLIIESGKAGSSFSVATSLINQGGIELYGAALSAGSIEMTDRRILATSSRTAALTRTLAPSRAPRSQTPRARCTWAPG